MSHPAAGKLSPPPIFPAIALMTVASFLFSGMNVGIRMATEEMHAFEVVFFRNLFAVLVMLPWIARLGFGVMKTVKLKLYFFRSLIGLGGMLAWFSALGILPIADAVALNFTTPLFVTLTAALLLHEKVGPRRLGATLVGFLGVIVILRPGMQEMSLAMTLPILSAFFVSLTAVLVKTLTRTERAEVIVFYMNVLLTPLSLIPALFVWSWPSLYGLAIVAAVGAMGTVAHVCFTRAYALADASAVMPADYFRLPFTAVLAYFLFSEIPDVWTLIGAGIIACSVLYIVRREAYLARLNRTKKPVSEGLPERDTP